MVKDLLLSLLNVFGIVDIAGNIRSVSSDWTMSSAQRIKYELSSRILPLDPDKQPVEALNLRARFR